MAAVQIGGRFIGPGHPPLLVAELSGNHHQNLDAALAMIDSAADAGADAIKLQTYTADSLTLDSSAPCFRIQEAGSLWAGETLYALYQRASTPYEWHARLFERAQQRGLLCFSTPFDESAVDFLESLDSPCYKVASFEVNHIPLLMRIGKTRKPVIMSTGMASEDEIDLAVRTLREAGAPSIILLKCTSSYPASPDDSNLLGMDWLRERFDCAVGLSDHTLGIAASVASVALGACLIERHYVLDRSAGGVDAAFSLEPAEFRQLCDSARIASRALGTREYSITEAEKKSRAYRRSIFVSQPVKQGDTLGPHNLKIVRPANGMPPSEWFRVLGQKAASDMEAGTPLQAGQVEKRRAGPFRGKAKRVTTVVPCYNLERYIGECVESLATQVTRFEHDILVCNDASPDQSAEVLAQLAAKYPNVRVLTNPHNYGLVRTMRRLLNEAEGDYIAYMDGDDVALPGKIEALADHLDRTPECALTYHEVDIFNSDQGTVTGRYSADFYNAAHIPESASVDHLLIFGVFLQASSVMFRAHDRFDQVLDHACKIICDYPLHLGNALSIKGTIDIVPGVLGKYRIHGGSFGAQTLKSMQRRQQVTDDLLLAADHAAVLGASPQAVAKSKLHTYFAAALYFLRADEIALFNTNIEAARNLSEQLDWAQDERLAVLYQHRHDPAYLRTLNLWR
jgi:N-acetylneuraminate synthase